MNKAKIFGLSLAGALLAATTALVPVEGFASDGYRSATAVGVGYRDHHDYRDRDRHQHSYGHRYSGPRGHAYGYYARPNCPTPYYYAPSYRSYYAPRYYDGGRSGWDIDLRYYFRD